MKLLQILNEIEVTHERLYTVKVGKDKELLIYPKDLNKQMSWNSAMRACKGLGDGKWRLPTIDELKAMYYQLHKKDKGNFKKDTWYWSSLEHDFIDAWGMDFWDGGDFTDDRSGYGQVRPVRDKGSKIEVPKAVKVKRT